MGKNFNDFSMSRGALGLHVMWVVVCHPVGPEYKTSGVAQSGAEVAQQRLEERQ